MESEEKVEEEPEIISAALFDLSAEELAALQAMEDEIIEEEQAIEEAAEASGDAEKIEAAVKEIASLEEEREMIVAQETEVMAEMEEMAKMEEALEDSPVEKPQSSEIDPKVACKDTCDAYVETIDSLKTQLKGAEELTNQMADSLAEIDPNMDNGEEGKALLRKMYKLSERAAEDSSPIMPDTPELCIDLVAGKVLQIETLNEDLDAAVDFRDFFAEVYCSAYVNSLVTMQDGLSQIFPGGFDLAIEEELQRAYGPFEIEELDAIEISAMTAYY